MFSKKKNGKYIYIYRMSTSSPAPERVLFSFFKKALGTRMGKYYYFLYNPLTQIQSVTYHFKVSFLLFPRDDF